MCLARYTAAQPSKHAIGRTALRPVIVCKAPGCCVRGPDIDRGISLQPAQQQDYISAFCSCRRFSASSHTTALRAVDDVAGNFFAAMRGRHA